FRRHRRGRGAGQPGIPRAAALDHHRRHPAGTRRCDPDRRAHDHVMNTVTQDVSVPREVPDYRVDFTRPRASDYCVVIPVINEGKRLHRLLERMAALSIAALADIVIVDGGSRDGSTATETLRALQVHTLITKTGAGKLSAQ